MLPTKDRRLEGQHLTAQNIVLSWLPTQMEGAPFVGAERFLTLEPELGPTCSLFVWPSQASLGNSASLWIPHTLLAVFLETFLQLGSGWAPAHSWVSAATVSSPWSLETDERPWGCSGG